MNDIVKQGQYEIFRTARRERVMVLDGDHFAMEPSYFTISEGAQGEFVARNAEDFDRHEILREGRFMLVEFQDDPEFQDIPYVFLERDGKFDEIYIPQGLPDEEGRRRRYIYTDHTIDAEQLEAYLSSPESESIEMERISAPSGEPPMEDYFDLTAGDLAERIRQMQPAELRELEEYEAEHKNRSTVINTIRSQINRLTH